MSKLGGTSLAFFTLCTMLGCASITENNNRSLGLLTLAVAGEHVFVGRALPGGGCVRTDGAW